VKWRRGRVKINEGMALERAQVERLAPNAAWKSGAPATVSHGQSGDDKLLVCLEVGLTSVR
jgi:hypothetical protein